MVNFFGLYLIKNMNTNHRWVSHLKKYKKSHPTLKHEVAVQRAKKTYKYSKKRRTTTTPRPSPSPPPLPVNLPPLPSTSKLERNRTRPLPPKTSASPVPMYLPPYPFDRYRVPSPNTFVDADGKLVRFFDY